MSRYAWAYVSSPFIAAVLAGLFTRWFVDLDKIVNGSDRRFSEAGIKTNDDQRQQLIEDRRD